jgi:hypothetical protein
VLPLVEGNWMKAGLRVSGHVLSLALLLLAASCGASTGVGNPEARSPRSETSISGIADVTALFESATPESGVREIESQLSDFRDVACVQVTTPADSLAEFDEVFPGVDLGIKDAVWVVRVALAQSISTEERRILSGEIADLLIRLGTLERVGIGIDLTAPDEWVPPRCLA